MKKSVITLVICLLVLPFTAVNAQVSVKKAKTQTPVITKQQVIPKRMKVAPLYSRAATTPDVNQHMTWGQFIDQLPVKPPSIRMKYRPPNEIDLNWRVFEQDYCAPAVVANNLMWLDAYFFRQISNDTKLTAGGVFLALKHGGDKYFSTMNEPGDPSA